MYVAALTTFALLFTNSALADNEKIFSNLRHGKTRDLTGTEFEDACTGNEGKINCPRMKTPDVALCLRELLSLHAIKDVTKDDTAKKTVIKGLGYNVEKETTTNKYVATIADSEQAVIKGTQDKDTLLVDKLLAACLAIKNPNPGDGVECPKTTLECGCQSACSGESVFAIGMLAANEDLRGGGVYCDNASWNLNVCCCELSSADAK